MKYRGYTITARLETTVDLVYRHGQFVVSNNKKHVRADFVNTIIYSAFNDDTNDQFDMEYYWGENLQSFLCDIDGHIELQSKMRH